VTTKDADVVSVAQSNMLTNKDGMSEYDSETDSSSSSSESDQSCMTYSKSRGATTDLDKTSINDAGIVELDYKPRSETSFETMVLTKSTFNSRIKGAGFRSDGKPRQIKKETLLCKVRTRCLIREKQPALAVCITMYNEEVVELKATLKGLIHNYNCLRAE